MHKPHRCTSDLLRVCTKPLNFPYQHTHNVQRLHCTAMIELSVARNNDEPAAPPPQQPVQPLPSEAEASSVAVGVSTLDGQSELVGNLLELSINPSSDATASSQQPGSTVSADAESVGVGLGLSRFFDESNGPFAPPSEQTSGDLERLIIKGGQISGTALSNAFASGLAKTTASARSLNVALADTDVISRYDGVLRIGSPSEPFSAEATAGGTDLSGANGEPLQLEAIAVSRGYEGNAESGNSLIGQIDATVGARAVLSPLNPEAAGEGLASADSVALENVDVTATRFGNGDGTASVIGRATTNVGLDGPRPLTMNLFSFRGRALGIDRSTILGSGELNNVIAGVGAINVSMPADGYNNLLKPDAELTGIGVNEASIITGGGNDTVIGRAELTANNGFDASNSTVDLAGFRNSDINTGGGNDTIIGQVDVADGIEGLPSDLSFRGFDNTNVNAGIGNDLIKGNAYQSDLWGGVGGDQILLSNAWDARLIGGLDNDLVSATGDTKNLVLDGGLGNDGLEGGDGDDTLMGGFGIDVSIGGAGSDTFVYSGAGALNGTASAQVNAALLDGSWGDRSQDAQIEVLNNVERVLDFESGSSGDVLQLSSALASIPADLWNNYGQVVDAQTAQALRYSGYPSVVVDTLANIQSMGIGSPRYAVAIDRNLLLYDADGNYSRGSQVVAAVNGDLAALEKSNFSFG